MHIHERRHQNMTIAIVVVVKIFVKNVPILRLNAVKYQNLFSQMQNKLLINKLCSLNKERRFLTIPNLK